MIYAGMQIYEYLKSELRQLFYWTGGCFLQKSFSSEFYFFTLDAG